LEDAQHGCELDGVPIARAFPWGIFSSGPCTGSESGNGNCGHTYGTDLSDAEKWAIIEYMKEL
jgi:hypothetical protein